MTRMLVVLLVLCGFDEVGAAENGAWHFTKPRSITKDALGQLPNAAQIKSQDFNEPPNKTIIHIKDWHFVAFDAFAADLRASIERSIDDDEMDRLYDEHLDEVNQVQAEQLKLLRRMIQRHGLKQVFVEGLATEDLVIYNAKIRVLRRMENELARWKQELRSVHQRRDELTAAGQDNAEEFRELSEFASKLDAILARHRDEKLRVGAVGRLMMSGELKTVVPLEDLDSYRRANPVDESGALRWDRPAMEKREDAQVSHLLKKRVSIVVLGGAHDLADNLKSVPGVSCRYVTIATPTFVRIEQSKK